MSSKSFVHAIDSEYNNNSYIYLIYFSFLPSDLVDQFQLSCEVSYLGKESFVWVVDLRSALSVASISSKQYIVDLILLATSAFFHLIMLISFSFLVGLVD